MRLFLFAAAIWGLTPLCISSAWAWSGHETLFSTTLQPTFGSALNEPDQGMDQNLPDSDDPYQERKWMGGTKGGGSQGFRHMYFGGWKLAHPITTFQIPPKAIGRAPDRVLETAALARVLLKHKDYAEEGIRKLGWSLHYLQDLAQPFHATQLVHWKMAAWGTLFDWPLGKGVENFIEETTRIISNYHLALENYVEFRLKGPKGAAPLFEGALQNPEQYATVHFDPKLNPKQLALELSKASVALAPELGKAEMAFFGEHLLKPEFDLRNDKGIPDYQAYAIRPELAEARTRCETVIAKALANALLASRALIQWALNP